MSQTGLMHNFRGACAQSSATMIQNWRKNNVCGVLKIFLAGIRMMKTTKRLCCKTTQSVLGSVPARAKCTRFSLTHSIEGLVKVQSQCPLSRAIQLTLELHCYQSDQSDNSHFDDHPANLPTMTMIMQFCVFVEAVMMAES